MQMDIERLKDKFRELYGNDDMYVFFSPSRVNLIGEHVDYNGGHVMPATIKMGTYGVVSMRKDNIVRMASENFDLRVQAELGDIVYREEDDWGNYVKGVLKTFMDAGYKAGGMDIYVSGDIPNGAGLSSSASLELLIAEMINHLFNDNSIDNVEMAKLCQRAENEFVGVMCGIMDQFIISVGKEKNCIVLDCDTLKYEYIEYDLEGYSLVIMNTNKRRELNESKYNERRSECQIALDSINRHVKIKNLCQLSIPEFRMYENFIEDPVVRKRAEHVVFENRRVLLARDALKAKSSIALGNLLKESHDSLRDLYEVTGVELDTIVQAANQFDGCIGSRMTGAGFGGCAIALVRKTEVDKFMEEVSEIYKEKIGYYPDFYITDVGDGSMKLIEQ